MATLKLDAEDIESRAWKKVEAFLKAERDELRIKNDELTQTPEMTAAIRGRIKLINDTLRSVEASNRPGSQGPANQQQ